MKDLDNAIALNDEAIAIRQKLVTDFPAVEGYRDTLANQLATYGQSLRKLGQLDAALNQMDSALAIYTRLSTDSPENLNYRQKVAMMHQRCAEVLIQRGSVPGAKEHLRDLLQMDAKLNANALNALAWSLATSSKDNSRDGEMAVELATKACELTNYKQSHLLDTLAAAYAEKGNFDTAVKWSQKAIGLLGASDCDIREELAGALERYKAKKPSRQAVNDLGVAPKNGD